MPWAALYFDAIPSRFPQHYLVGEFARSCNERWISALTKAAALLAISEFSAGEAAQLTGTTQASSIGSGLSAAFLRAVEQRSSSPRGRRRDNATILYVGGLDWRKTSSLRWTRYRNSPLTCVKGSGLFASARLQPVARSCSLALGRSPAAALRTRDASCQRRGTDRRIFSRDGRYSAFGDGRLRLTVLEAMACGCRNFYLEPAHSQSLSIAQKHVRSNKF